MCIVGLFFLVRQTAADGIMTRQGRQVALVGITVIPWPRQGDVPRTSGVYPYMNSEAVRLDGNRATLHVRNVLAF